MDLNLEEINLPFWIIKNGIVNEKSELLSFKERLFLYDIFNDFSRNQVIKKCAQVGLTVTKTIKSYFAAKKLGYNVIFTMASDDDVSEFVRTKADKIFQANELMRKNLFSDTVGLKQIGNRFVYYKGTKSKTAAISTTADILIHDEIDRSDLGTIEDYQSRILTSKYKATWYISNPSQIGIGVDEYWKLSDRKEWFIKCVKCNQWQTLTWEENVDQIRGLYVCKNCNEEIKDWQRIKGKWMPTAESKGFSGYHISQMMAPWISAKELIHEKENRTDEYFRNFILGEPYQVGETASFRQGIMDSQTARDLRTKPFFLGVDVGRVKHYLLGNKEGVFQKGKFEAREDLEEILKKWEPTTVIDAGPERTWAEEIQKKFPRVFLCFFHKDKDIKELIKWGGHKGTFEDRKNYGYVWADRTRIIDKTWADILNGEILYGMTKDELEEYIRHWETMRRIVVVEEKSKKERYVWESSTGLDHFVFTTVYYNIARQRSGAKVEFISDEGKEKKVIERTDSGFVMRDLKEIIEEGIEQDGTEEG